MSHIIQRGSHINPSWLSCGSSTLIALEFQEGGKPEIPEKNSHIKNSTHIWHQAGIVFIFSALHKQQGNVKWACRVASRDFLANPSPESLGYLNGAAIYL